MQRVLPYSSVHLQWLMRNAKVFLLFIIDVTYFIDQSGGYFLFYFVDNMTPLLFACINNADNGPLTVEKIERLTDTIGSLLNAGAQIHMVERGIFLRLQHTSLHTFT